MCGIFGYAGNPSKNNYEKLHNFLFHLAHQSEARGKHSTGFAARFDSGQIIADKLPYRGSTFCVNSGKFCSLKKRMPTTFIGHTRYGTGSSPKINNNNHPFFGKNYHMVHNGVIPSFRDIAIKEGVLDKLSSETDSEIILRIFEKKRKNYNKSKSVEYVLNKIWGNMAIALLDLNSPEIILFRNDNPLSVFDVDRSIFGGQIYFFCSTATIFESAWKACFNAKLSKDIVESTWLNSNSLYTISNKSQVINTKPEKFIVYKLDVKQPFVKESQYFGKGYKDSEPWSNVISNTSEKFFTKVIDANNPSRGTAFDEKDIDKIKELMSKSPDKLIIDGLTLSQYSCLASTMNKLKLLNREESNAAV